jgi:tRNA(fMet)-specific endonuclease VapC
LSDSALYLLDTNTVAYFIDGRSPAARKAYLEQRSNASIAISVITEAETLYGLARKPEATRLRAAFEHFCSSVQILDWDSEAAHVYGRLRARLRASGRNLDAMDLLIASHAIAVRATLVTRDAAFAQLGDALTVVNWATDI